MSFACLTHSHSCLGVTIANNHLIPKRGNSLVSIREPTYKGVQATLGQPHAEWAKMGPLSGSRCTENRKWSQTDLVTQN